MNSIHFDFDFEGDTAATAAAVVVVSAVDSGSAEFDSVVELSVQEQHYQHCP